MENENKKLGWSANIRKIHKIVRKIGKKYPDLHKSWNDHIMNILEMIEIGKINLKKSKHQS